MWMYDDPYFLRTYLVFEDHPMFLTIHNTSPLHYHGWSRVHCNGHQELFRFIGRNGCASLQIRNSLSDNDDEKTPAYSRRVQNMNGSAAQSAWHMTHFVKIQSKGSVYVSIALQNNKKPLGTTETIQVIFTFCFFSSLLHFLHLSFSYYSIADKLWCGEISPSFVDKFTEFRYILWSLYIELNNK